MSTDLGDWRPVTEESIDSVGPGPASALHGLFDRPGDPPDLGEPLPPLWHWLAFLPRVAERDLGEDGHPKLGGFLPPVAYPRRLFAGGRIEFDRPAQVGELLTRRSTVTGIDEKDGRSGALVFVTVRHDFLRGARHVLTEEQDLVYRPAVDAPPNPDSSSERGAEPEVAADRWPWAWDLEITPTLLFRFSALTYNAHRIHYDRRYATDVEGHSGLVVHGPLQAIALAELCRQHEPGRELKAFRFRARRAAYDDGPLLLRGRPDDRGGSEADGLETVSLAAFNHLGKLTMDASATFTRLAAPDPRQTN